jgi:HAE1 family hydrophobic/amphiphilic exporter-1
MNFSEISIKRPVFVTMVILAIVVLGINAYTRLPVELFPKVDIPWVTVVTVYPGANPEEIETQVTDKLEDELSSLADLKSMKSDSEENLSMIALEFDVGVNLDAKAADVRDKVAAAKHLLPDDSEDPIVLKLDLDSFPIMFFSVSSNRPPIEVRKTAEDIIKKRLEQVPGVATVALLGGKEREIHIDIDRNRLAAKNLNILQVVEALGRDNLNVPVGKVKHGTDESLVRVVGEYATVGEIRGVEIPTQLGMVKISEIATVTDSYKEVDQYARLMGENAVNLSLQKQSGANTVEVSNRALKEMLKLEKELPDFNVKLTSDMSRFIKDAVSDVQQNLLYGALFATIMIILFLRDARSTFIIFLAIPVAIIGTFMPIYTAGFTINFMSLMGLAISVGTLVDNSTVVLENIFRHLEMGKKPQDAARDGIKEVGLAVIASGSTNICVFLPMAFMSGMVGQFFKEFGFTVAFATIFSIFVAFTLTPALAAKLLKPQEGGANGAKKQPPNGFIVILALLAMAGATYTGLTIGLPMVKEALTGQGGINLVMGFAITAVSTLVFVIGFIYGLFPAFDKFFGAIQAGYPAVLKFCVHKWTRYVVILAVTVMFASAIFIMAKGLVGFEFVGEGDTGEFQVIVEMPPYATLGDTDNVVRKVETIVQKLPEFEVMSSTVGAQISGSGTQSSDPNYGYIMVKLTDFKDRDRTTNQILQEMRKKVATIPDALFQISQASMGGPPGQLDLNVEVNGPNMDTLVALSDKIEKIVKSTEGTIDVNNSWKIGKQEVRVEFNKKKLKEYGLDIATVSMTMRAAIEGDDSIKFRDMGDEYDIKVRFQPDQRMRVEDIGDITLPTMSGPVKISSISTIYQEQGPVGISRKNGIREITIGGNLAGRPLGTVQKEIQEKIDEMKMPPGYNVHFAGQSEDMEEMNMQMGLAMGLAILFVYMVMAAQFESFFYPFVIMFTLPLTFIGVVWGLYLGRMTMNMMSMTGIVMLIGIVVNNAIIYIDFVNQYREKGMERNEAIQAAGPVRLRPILITSLTTICGMMPAAFMQGSGGGFRQPMAVAALGGMVVSSMLTLLVIPTMYTIVDDIVSFCGRIFGKLAFWRRSDAGSDSGSASQNS